MNSFLDEIEEMKNCKDVWKIADEELEEIEKASRGNLKRKQEIHASSEYAKKILLFGKEMERVMGQFENQSDQITVTSLL